MSIYLSVYGLCDPSSLRVQPNFLTNLFIFKLFYETRDDFCNKIKDSSSRLFCAVAGYVNLDNSEQK